MVSVAVAVWATGVLLLTIRLLHGGLYLRRLRRATTPLDQSAFADVLARVRHSLAVSDLPPIFLSERIATPVVVALLRPAVLLPASLPESISLDSLQSVLLHECAHIVRRDHWVGVLQRLVAIVYWPHPLVHQMNRQLALRREEVCDNHVLAAAESTDYADTLLELTVCSQDRVAAFSSIGMFGLHWQLEDRVRGLFDRCRDRSVRLDKRSRLGTLVSACVVLAASATLQIGSAAQENVEILLVDEVLADTAADNDSGKPAADNSARLASVSPDEEVLDVDGNPRQPGHDLDGEPLPRGALARLGSRRLRHDEGYKTLILPDNKTLISSGRQSGVRLWDADTGKLLRELDRGSRHVETIDIALNANCLAVLSRKSSLVPRQSTRELTLWNTSTWQARAIATWTTYPSAREFVAVSPDALMVATGGARGNVRVRDVLSGKEVANYSVARHEIESLAFSPDGVLLAMATRDAVYLWDWHSGKAPKELEGRVERTQVVVFSPHGRLLATGGRGDFAAGIWDVASGQMVSRLKGKAEEYAPHRLTFSADGKSLLVPAGGANGVEVFDIETGQLQKCLVAGGGSHGDMAVSPDGRLLTSAGSAAIKLWELPEGRCRSDRFTGHEGTPYEVVFTPDGQHVVTGCWDKTIRIWEADTGRQLRVLDPIGYVVGVAVSPGGKTVSSCNLDDTVRLWDFESGRQIFSLPGHGRLGGNRDHAVRFDADGRRFLSFGRDLYLRVWNTRNGKALTEHAIRPSGIKLEETEDGTLRLADPSAAPIARSGPPGKISLQAQLTADGDRLLLGDGRSVYLFDTDSGREIDKWTFEDSLGDSRISPDGTTLATIGIRRPKPDPTEHNTQPSRPTYRLRIHRLSFKQKAHEIELPGSVHQALAFSPDGRLLATGIGIWDHDNPARSQRWISIWDVETGREVARIDGYDNQAHTLAFSPDGKRLASTHSDTTVLLWDIDKFQVAQRKND